MICLSYTSTEVYTKRFSHFWLELNPGFQFFCVQFCSSIPVLPSLMIYQPVCKQINMMGATSGAATTYPSRAPYFTLGFQWGCRYSIFSFMCPIFFCSLCSLFFNLWILITPWVSSNYSYIYIHGKRDFNCASINCQLFGSYLPTIPSYEVYISKLIHYTRACSLFQDQSDLYSNAYHPAI